MKESKELIRESGIDVLGTVPWGMHVCLFYKKKEDLINMLVPYFKAGLENNEFCMWITSKPLSVKEAEEAMKKAMSDFDEYLSRGQIEIVSYRESYIKKGRFDKQRVLIGWMDKLNQALAKGYEGMRVTGNTTWVDEGVWRDFIDYEEQVNTTIEKYQMIAICTYHLDRCGPVEIMDVLNTHQLAIIEEGGKWALVKNAERKRAQERARQYQAQLKSLASQIALVEERERRRIAQEMHDLISQRLVISKIQLDALRASKPSKEIVGILDEVCESLGQVVEEARSLSSSVHSPLLELLGFETAVAGELEKIERKYDIATELEEDKQPKPLDDDILVLLFRDVRELLINVVKHANANKIKVSIRRVESQIRVSVEDDGIGFDPDEIASRSIREVGFGLFSIQERLEELGGNLEIKSEPDHGCKVVMTAPIKQSKNKE